MLRFFDMFGRSSDLTALDAALRAAGLHPLLIPEPVKLTILQLRRKHAALTDKTMADAAQLLAYCVLEQAQFVAVNGPDAAAHADQRITAAIAGEAAFDEKLILLALHSGVISQDMAERFDIANDEPAAGV
ncbi:hypothetical protein [Yoonia vestfoldensis]|jgi:hypothetical protein|uniref:Uncharacterized protein n=1 Tax=Yoonia vestfoldensis TaxID=245188 RepID=A0A1Y0EI11_9RHOB|nr:hypothetical protein [Yoonia vestfoldensis]ARU03080.1 hypothetical protein LOKVESSMR4R_03815 [Yoonia vestfoldensis]